jgi:Icc-related predicted phosphoesterase
MLPDDSALEPQTMGCGQPEFVRMQFRALVETIRKGPTSPPVLVILGNHDWVSSAAAMGELAAEDVLTVLDHKEPVKLSGLSFVGYPCSPPTPWFVKDFERLDQPGDQLPLLGGARWDARFSKAIPHGAAAIFGEAPTIADDLAQMTVPRQPWVFVAHAPPFGTNLDRSYKGESWGSRAVRAAIERYQPLLSLHGHVHESPTVSGEFVHRIGNTVAVNPGQARDVLKYALIEINVPACRVVDLQHGQEP